MKTTCLLLIASLLFCTGCKKYKLSKEDLEWQPYKKGDLLIFKSSKNELDTITITDIKLYINPNDPLDVNPTYHQTLFVNGDISLREPRKQGGRLFYKEFISVIEMHAGLKKSYVRFVLKKTSDTLDYPRTVIPLDDLKQKFERQSKLKYNSIEIKAEEFYDTSFNYDLENFYWSKKYGYVRYEFKNGYYWELQEFIRDNKNILK